VENQLLVYERKDLRTKYGPKIVKGVYRRRYNHELDKEFNSPNPLNVTEDKQITLRWSHDQKTRRPTTKNSIQSQIQWARWADGVNSDSLALGAPSSINVAHFYNMLMVVARVRTWTFLSS
jgi:hypothetical protein